VTISEVHLMIDPEDGDRHFARMREFVGKDITVAGKRAVCNLTVRHKYQLGGV
jgi:hypothetical protein